MHEQQVEHVHPGKDEDSMLLSCTSSEVILKTEVYNKYDRYVA